MNEDEEWQNNKPGSWTSGKKDEGNYSKFKNRDNNEERSNRKPSKWGDKEPNDEIKEDRWSRKSVEHTSAKDEGPHQTSAPMDLDNYEGESVDNIEQPQEIHEKDTSNITEESKQHSEYEKELQEETQENQNLGGFDTNPYEVEKENDKQNINEPCSNDEHSQFVDHQNDFSNNLQELPQEVIEKIPQNSENYSRNNFELQNTTENVSNNDEYTLHNVYLKESSDDFKTNQDDRGFKQNSQFEPEYTDMPYENEQSNYDQSMDSGLLNDSNRHEHNPITDFVSEVDDTITEKEQHRDEDCNELPRSFYFGTDGKSSINKSLEVEQLGSDDFPIESTVQHPPDNEAHEMDTIETSQN